MNTYAAYHVLYEGMDPSGLLRKISVNTETLSKNQFWHLKRGIEGVTNVVKKLGSGVFKRLPGVRPGIDVEGHNNWTGPHLKGSMTVTDDFTKICEAKVAFGFTFDSVEVTLSGGFSVVLATVEAGVYGSLSANFSADIRYNHEEGFSGNGTGSIGVDIGFFLEADASLLRARASIGADIAYTLRLNHSLHLSGELNAVGSIKAGVDYAMIKWSYRRGVYRKWNRAVGVQYDIGDTNFGEYGKFGPVDLKPAIKKALDNYMAHSAM